MRLSHEEVESLEARVVLTFPPPFAQANSYTFYDDVLDTAAESKPSVLANDMDMNGDPMTASVVTGPAHGSLTLNSNGHFVYTPTLGYAGGDSFVYKVFDGTHYSSNTTVTLTASKPLSMTASLEDRPSAGVQANGLLGTSAFTGEVHAGQPVGDGYSLSYESIRGAA